MKFKLFVNITGWSAGKELDFATGGGKPFEGQDDPFTALFYFKRKVEASASKSICFAEVSY
jgi:hypothetical protein